jgi:Methyltransferase domain
MNGHSDATQRSVSIPIASKVPLSAAGARRERHALFLKLLATLPAPVRILDVGGTVAYWETVGLPNSGVDIELLNIERELVQTPFTSVAGDARDLSRYKDKSFDVVFSNSVLGHVGGQSDQQRMAQEVRRVGTYYFVQTPNHGFPIDWRTMVPLFHFLSARSQAWCFERFAVGAYRRARDKEEALHWATRVRNIRGAELSTLFPSAHVVPEKVAGFTKSFILHNFPSPVTTQGEPIR